ncbi:MAG: RagB/SusD family nutrient uptake outer membrane protein [Tannerella sp.]|jgi:hypothetical protein|nr:RagB/SusD family nutrient uptake outer membrane protein [Tannerella sp.]
MKQIKYIQIILFAVLLTMSGTSCSDSFLDEKLYSSYSAGQTDPNSIEAAVIGLHRTYAELWGWSSRQGFLGCWQLGTDVATAAEVEGVETPFFQYANLNAENGGVSYLWQKCYDFINNANIIIAAVGEDSKGAAAEAKFFRAYAYNTLATLWGDVPLLSEPVTAPRTDLTRQPVAEVDQLIDDDLSYAIANLPDVGQAKSESRINKDIARQLAGEAYLRIGLRDNSYFQKAENVLTEIIGSGNYALVENRYGKYLGEGGDGYRDMFRWGNQRRSQGNTEAVWTFEMEYNRNINGGTIDNPQHRRVWQPAIHEIDGMVNSDSLGGRGVSRLRLSNFTKYTIWNGLDGDIRNSNYNIRRATNYNRPGFSAEIGVDANGFRVAKDAGVKNITIQTGDPLIPFETDSLKRWGPYVTKWGGYDADDDFGYAIIKDYPVMRLGETYLLRAEARFRQNKLSEAADDINKLRDRAFKDARSNRNDVNLGQVNASNITLDFILDERARELIGEENRRMTLVRTGTLKNRIERYKDINTPPNKEITGYQDFNALLPIPLTEIQLNKDAKLKQNPGYE